MKRVVMTLTNYSTQVFADEGVEVTVKDLRSYPRTPPVQVVHAVPKDEKKQ